MFKAILKENYIIQGETMQQSPQEMFGFQVTEYHMSTNLFKLIIQAIILHVNIQTEHVQITWASGIQTF